MRMRGWAITGVIGVMWAAVCVSSASAMPAFARAYKQQFGYMPSCNACHSDGGGSTLNAYGEAFKAAGKSPAAFATIADQDSDGDGVSNAIEAVAKANPGSKTSTQAQPGNWLDMASLIPKEVQAAFPGILTWVPRDALLTPADIQAAAAMGATLGTDDENTIYIPVQEQRPAGTALIFPVTYEGNTGFLLMTTDRTLKITAVTVLHADKLPALRDNPVLSTFNGQQAQSITATAGGTLDTAVSQAVKKAGVLLYVRLKGA